MKDFYMSWKNNDEGFSARKLSAFYAIVCVSGCVSLKYTTTENLTEVLKIWLVFALLALGLVTMQQIIELKKMTDPTITPKPETKTEEPPAPPLP